MKSTSFTPRLMQADQAAHYLGVSVTYLRSLDLQRKRLGSKRLYDVLELDDFASSLPNDRIDDNGAQAGCDRAFGCST